MDGQWKIPNQKWMITGGTHGYPYDLGNPHNLPYIIIFHKFSLGRLGAKSVDSSVKIHPGKSAEAREGSCPNPHVLRSTNGNSARCCDRQRLGHGNASFDVEIRGEFGWNFYECRTWPWQMVNFVRFTNM